MTEQIADAGRGISLAYERIGDAGAEPLVLVAGLGQQLHSWPDAFCAQLADRGFEVIRFDNRDAGRSTHPRFRPPSLPAMLAGRFPEQQYDLKDMAADTIGLFDALDLETAHIAGVSMGGMISQTVAALYPDRIRTLTSIMSTTGSRLLGRPAFSTLRMMGGKPPKSREEAVESAVRMFRHIGSHGFPFDEARVRELAGTGWDRDPTAGGVGRQLAAIMKSGNRTALLRKITAPTLVIHGDRDRMVHPTGGGATARAIRGARRETVRGMGHDLPEGAWPTVLDLIDKHARSSDVTAP
ncbi:pimeloyl-ACP methyl ester carboxylesterase [Amycolatopsis lexingtonensis]|uniref:Pimeloyl-ACP methyl ester carboxylesterase n=1 Tax=Amycolatopsis lexingtonensis TaxID=218822 RepID=A0ABR9HUE9_9PSEU|nr:alpha/beta hydrolase [Amycolatopsis lexingtonensis]MBE1494549.1 pimeloyl-ACP methyl ester carboxylesterase [Amycolatopsis lexingtonensis]